MTTYNLDWSGRNACHASLVVGSEHALEIQGDKECGDTVDGDVEKAVISMEEQVPGECHAVADAGEKVEGRISGGRNAVHFKAHLGLCKLVINCTAYIRENHAGLGCLTWGP